jgi:hypothetical protein
MVPLGSQLEPTGTTAPMGVWLAEETAEEVGVGEAADEDALKPAQKPPWQVLKAHCWSEVHEDWKLPQTGCSMELTA